MGWNDRLPEDPNIPYESQQDKDDYDAWAEYVEDNRSAVSDAKNWLVKVVAYAIAAETVMADNNFALKEREYLRALMNSYIKEAMEDFVTLTGQTGQTLTSQNIDPGALVTLPENEPERGTVIRETLERCLAKFVRGPKQ